MSLRTLWQSQSQLTRLIFAVLLFFGYFDYSVIVKPVGIFFQISSLTGKILVNKFLTVCSCILKTIRLTYRFFEILYEDSLIFIKDATDKFAFIVYLLREIYLFLEGIAWTIAKALFGVGEAIFSVLTFSYQTILTFKEGIQFLGQVIWRAFVNSPEIIKFHVHQFYEFTLNTINVFRSFISQIQDKIIESLERTYFFLFDIQLESVFGLIIGAVLLTILCVKFRGICFYVISAYKKLQNKFISFGVSLLSRSRLEKTSGKKINYEDERLCIVCQYEPKEIIIFPCKHLCLCRACSFQLIRNRPLCPICRGDITGTLKVYL